MEIQMNKQRKPDEQEVYGDIPADRPQMSQDYLDATLPDHVKARIAEREAGKKAPKKDNRK